MRQSGFGCKAVVLIISICILYGCRPARDIQSNRIVSEDKIKPSSIGSKSLNLNSDESRFGIGRYMGYANLENFQQSYPLIIDLIAYRKNSRVMKMRAIVKILNESFVSSEYSAVYFPYVDYFLKEKKFDFKSVEDAFSLERVELHGDMLNGKIKFSQTNIVGNFFASWKESLNTSTADQDMLSANAVAHNIAGRYEATCEGIKHELRLETRRKLHMEKELIKPFNMAISGHLLKPTSKNCLLNECQDQEDLEGGYNFLERSILLTSKQQERKCTVNEKGLECGDCGYALVKKERKIAEHKPYHIYPRNYHVRYSKNESIEGNNSPKSMEGEYFGFVHHEHLNQYQLLRLEIKSRHQEKKNGESWFYLYGSATLFFGDGKNKEFISYRFLPRRYVPARKIFIFDGNGETLFAVNQWMQGGLKGFWYSKNFGRVGTVEMVKSRMPSIAKKAQLMNSLTQQFSEKKAKLRLEVKSGISLNSKDVYPLEIRGWLADGGLDAKRVSIANGLFDFYTGALNIQLEDNRLISGVSSDNGVELYIPATRITSDGNDDSRSGEWVRRSYLGNLIKFSWPGRG
ncbi:MAG: hypothetical protein R3B45_07835 [Bdellovibrionota bacterium]